MRHLVALLTTSDLQGLKRLVYIVDNEMLPADSLDTEFVIVVNTQDEYYYNKVLEENFSLRVVRTSSNGTAARGKNSCQELMLKEGFDYLTQFDADDILYPTFLVSLQEHIRRMPGLDVLGIIPVDYCDYNDVNEGHVFKLSESITASVWGISLTSVDGDRQSRGVGRHSTLFSAEHSTPSQDYFILQSRKACKIMMDETMVQAEDHLQSFKYLAEHQKGKLLYVQTMSSDMYFIDKTFPGSVQKTTQEWDYVSALKEKVLEYVPEWRSSFAELPCLYIDLYLNHVDKETWLKTLFKSNKKRAPLIYLPSFERVDILNDDMLLVDFMSQDHCEDLIALSDRHGGWAPLPGDIHPAQEIRMKELGEWIRLEKHWLEYVEPIISAHWEGCSMYGLRDAFTMRYSLDTQTSLTHHCDNSLVTGSVKLNNNYEGASLVFPRQKFNNNDIPVGKMLLFPGQVTHGHHVTELTSGVKYSLTAWSKTNPYDN